MARAKGRDVVIELMDSVAKLEAATTRHADLLESLSEHAIAMSVEMTALSAQLTAASQRMTSLESEVHLLARGFVDTTKLARSIQLETGRVARLLGEFAGSSSARFDSIEGRLNRLEKKAG